MSKSPSVPFNWPFLGPKAKSYVNRAFDSGSISGNGPISRQVEGILSEIHRGAPALLTPSCSHALELAARLIGFEPGDEIIVPSYTFVTTVSAFVAEGATPVFCDIDEATLGLDPEKARSLITSRTRAICIVHYGGVPAHPEEFRKMADEFGLVLIEDNAHGFGGSSAGRPLGTFGELSTLSFHETKNITCGEGGALIVNDEKFVERAEILREKGTDRTKFFKGQVDKYTWVDVGSSWVLSDILAAVLVSQLEQFDLIQAKRHRLVRRYSEGLAGWAEKVGVRFGPTLPNTAHMAFLILNEGRTEFLDAMRSFGIGATFHYQPLHLSRVGQHYLKKEEILPVTERVAQGLVRLPLFVGLDIPRQDAIIDAVLSFGK